MNAPSHRLGDYLDSRREKGEEGLPTLSVTLDRGLVRRESLDRKTDTNLSASQHLKVMSGDIAYNMMRMWQGASGLADEDALVSPAYVVLASKDNTDPRYVAYLFKTPKMIHRFWAYSYGLTNDRLRLYPKDILRVPADFPPLPEQRKIAEILSTWDRAIEVSEALLATARRQKRALMQALLTGHRRFPEFEGQAWKEVRLGEVGATFTGLTGKTKDDFGEGFPFITYMNIFKNSRIDPNHIGHVSVSPNERQNRVKYGDLFFTTSSETPKEVGMSSVLLDDIPNLFLNSFCFGFRLHDFETIRPKFARFFFRGQMFRKKLNRLAQGATRYNLSKTNLLKLRFKLPPVKEQDQIYAVLEVAQNEEDIIKIQLDHLRTEKKALMQQLLTGKRRVVV